MGARELTELQHYAEGVAGVSRELIRQTGHTLRQLNDTLRAAQPDPPPADARPTEPPTSVNTMAGDLPSLPGCRVLVVDDNPDVADITGELFALAGCDVRVCYGGTDALAVAEEFRPAVAVLDLHMPGMPGDVLAQRLRTQAGGRKLALLAVTALRDDDARRRVVRAGFDRHLTKPVASDHLLTALRDAATLAGV